VVPQYVIAAIERATGGNISVGEARLFFPLTVKLSDVRLVGQDASVVVSIRRVIIRPRWISVPRKTVWVDSLRIDQPQLQLRRTQDGAWRWPALATNPRKGLGAALASWQIHLGRLEISDGIVELLDEKPSRVFHALVDHIVVSLASVTLPFKALHLNGAASGEVVGYEGHAAPWYCSGWLDLAAADLQLSCQLKSLALAAFEPYYHGPPEIRVYSTTLSSTSQLLAKDNQMQGRIQLELGHLEEGDISVRGRNIIDVKKLTGGQIVQLKGELSLTGPLDRPSQWHGAFLAGNEHVQHLIDRLLERGVKAVKISPWGNEVRISMLPASKETMSDIETASKEVQEALDILVTPTPEELPSTEAAPAVSPPIEPITPAVSSEQAEPDAVSSPSAPPETPTPYPPSQGAATIAPASAQ
jgi:hypothetical protein